MPEAQLRTQLDRLVDAYRVFSLPRGNGFKARRVNLDGRDLTRFEPLVRRRSLPRLNVRELAGLWHLPGGEDVPLLERAPTRQLLPLPSTVNHGCRIGVSVGPSQSVPVLLPDELLRRHLLLVAKTGRGKSSLLLRLAQHVMACPLDDRRWPTLVLVDPHRDLARAALGVVPPGRQADLVFLDVSDATRPFALNLLDVGLGWEPHRAVANTLAIFRREFEGSWGNRMEDAFRFAALSLMAANQAICERDPDRRSRQHTILSIPALFTNEAFRRSIVAQVEDAATLSWWSTYFDPLDRKFQLEVVNPVLTKVNRFLGTPAARAIVGQPRSTIDVQTWLGDGTVVIVDTAKGIVGDDASALIGGTLLNLLAPAVAEQAELPANWRRPVAVIADEFHSYPSVDYEAYLSELGKYGASLFPATQSLARLDAIDDKRERALRALVFANLDGIFAFQTSAEDAHYLLPELGGGLDVEDLVAERDHHCYARISVGGERLPPFSVHLDPPPVPDPRLADRLTAASARRHGRPIAEVERAINARLREIAAMGRSDRPSPDEPKPPCSRGNGPAGRDRPPQDPPAGPYRSTLSEEPLEGDQPPSSDSDEEPGKPGDDPGGDA